MRSVFNANAVEDQRQIVGHYCITRPLGSNTNHGRNEKPSTICGASEHLLDCWSLLAVAVCPHSCPNLSDLMHDEGRILITSGMVFD